MGRPSSFTQKAADAVCERIANGESLRTICENKNMPSARSVFRWLADDKREDFRRQYARAREAQADFMAEEILQIADDGTNDTYKTDDGEVTNHDVIARSRLRVDARKWLAGKLAPKKYGEKLGLGAADGLAPLTVQVVRFADSSPAA